MPSQGEVARLEQVRVQFGATMALDRVDLCFPRGAVHALLGENGAGKSTALRVLAGQLEPADGTLHIQPGAGVGWAPQELELPLDLTIAEWIFLGREDRRGPFLDRRAMEEQTSHWLARFRLGVTSRDRIANLGPSQRKIVQILRALIDGPDLLLLDEPTAVLGDEHSALLFALIRQLRREGTAVAYVTHRLSEALALADQVSVLRDGQVVWTGPAQQTSAHFLLDLMAGPLTTERMSHAPLTSEPAVEVRHLSCGHVSEFSLTLCRGEVVGLAGLAGSGRSTVLECIARRRRPGSGSIVTRGSIAFVPEDRRHKGLAAALSVRENLFLPAPRWWIRARHERCTAQQWLAQLRVRTPTVDAPVSWLSGGNQQKLLFARALRQNPDVLLADEPTAGVDVATKVAIHRLLHDCAQRRAAVLISSSEVSELLALCHRIVALREGRTVAEASTAAVDEATVVGWITGALAPRVVE